MTRRGLLLKTGTVVDAALIAYATSTKNKDRIRGPDMHSSKKSNQWLFGMKAHIGADAESGLVHAVRGTSGHVSDIAEANPLLHGEESIAFGDTRYQGVEKRPDAKANVTWHLAMRPGKRRAPDRNSEAYTLLDKAEKLKASVRAKVEHPFQVIKRQFGFVKVRDRDLKKNTGQLFRLFALSNPWLVRSTPIGNKAWCAQKQDKGPAKGDGGPFGYCKRRSFRMDEINIPPFENHVPDTRCVGELFRPSLGGLLALTDF